MKVLGSARLDRDTRKKSRTRRLALVGALGVLTASVLVLPGQAVAATKCDAPRGQSCLGVMKNTPLASSISVNGVCVPNLGSSQTRPGIKVPADGKWWNPPVLPYGDRNCGSGSQITAGVVVGWDARPDNDNFRWVTITTSGFGVD
ncbi:hypothetical protein [Amycolatopsis sp. NPDC059657]|uniref:hypothetical protein n=1 Tax=Amycolatopsis sp. NPDC059657 TaxID=3346899 RepID=UPI00366D440B